MHKFLKYLGVTCIWFVFFFITVYFIYSVYIIDVPFILKQAVAFVFLYFWTTVAIILYRESNYVPR